jgi:hypothetical protein
MKDIVLSLNIEDLKLIINMLSTQPYNAVAPLIAKINQQVVQQNQAKQPDQRT